MRPTLRKNLSLWWQFTLRNVELRHKGSYLGFIWAVLNPLIMLALYVLVFGYIFGGKFGTVPGENAIDYGLGIFLGLALYNFASEVICVAPTVIADNANFVKKVVFPLEVLPASTAGAAVVHLLITLILVAVGAVCFGRGLPASAPLLLVVLVPLILGCLGLAWLFSALGVFLRDIRQVLPALTTGLMFASAIFYSHAKIPATAWMFLRFNPMIHAVENARALMLWGTPVHGYGLLYLYGTALLSLAFGWWTFRKLKPAFADVL